MMLERETAPTLQPLYEAFCKALSDAVALAGYTYRTLPSDMRLQPEDFCGLTCYTPQPDVKMSELNAYFKKTYRFRIRSAGQLSRYSCNNTCAITRIIY